MAVYAMTGGATGIGAALKNKLTERGDRIIVVDIKGGDVTADLSNEQGRAAAIEGIKDLASDGLDGFIACAGLGPHVEPKSLITGVNYFGAVSSVEGAKALVKPGGSIVVVASNSASMDLDSELVEMLLAGEEAKSTEHLSKLDSVQAGSNAYCGSKRAIAIWTRRNAPAFAKQGIRLNAVAPGPTDTPLVAAASIAEGFEESMAMAANSIPLGHKAEPEMIADSILFLLGEQSRFVAGSVLFVDGAQDSLMRPDQF